MTYLDDVLILRGSNTAKAGFQNERDVINKFNDWRNDEDAQKWLGILGCPPVSIKVVVASKITGSHKADIRIRVTFVDDAKTKDELISVKLVSTPPGFNQIDKRRVENYSELWSIPEDIKILLKRFTGEILPTETDIRDKRRIFIDELNLEEQFKLVDFFEKQKQLVAKDIFQGRGELAADWMLIYLKSANIWTLKPMSEIIDFYTKDPVYITLKGSLRIGKVTMQRKGGDGGRDSAKMLQFKVSPLSILVS